MAGATSSQVACGNAGRLMHAAASVPGLTSRSTADGPSTRVADRRPRFEQGSHGNIREFKIGDIRSSAAVFLYSGIGKPQGLGSEPRAPRSLSNPPVQRTGPRLPSRDRRLSRRAGCGRAPRDPWYDRSPCWGGPRR